MSVPGTLTTASGLDRQEKFSVCSYAKYRRHGKLPDWIDIMTRECSNTASDVAESRPGCARSSALAMMAQAP
jgi:hypothetical protein